MTKMLKGKNLQKATWRYAIVKQKNEMTGEYYYTVGEVYPPSDIFGWPEEDLPAYTKEQSPYGETPKELLEALKMMVRDVEDCIKKDEMVDDEHCSKLPVKEIDWGEITKDSIPMEEVFKELEEKIKKAEEEELNKPEGYVCPDDHFATD